MYELEAQHRDSQAAGASSHAGFRFALLLSFLILFRASAAGAVVDVLHYDAEIEPNMAEQTIAGAVSIQFRSLANNLSEITLDAQELQVEEVSEKGSALKFEAKEGHVLIRLARRMSAGDVRVLKIRYRGKPARGLKFFADHLYAAYNTPRWMVCNFDPGDRATLSLRLTVPEDFKTVANGNEVGRKSLPQGRTQYVWRDDAPVPPYVYGFAAGRFREVLRRKGSVRLYFLARDNYMPAEVEKIFADTPDILDFFEQRAGVAYPQKRYTQVLASGSVAQEMSAFTVIRENYGRDVLDEPREDWLIAHEFAHQWWGIRIACAGWADFWLNEGFAEFMMSAYREHRFGREEYDRDMELARMSYARIREAGRDRQLAYREAIAESQASGGGIVYNKGALALNLLRYELGEDAFWRGVRLYTTRNFGRSVVTNDLRQAMEEAAGKSLERFFEQWVYGTGLPDIVVRHRVEGDEVVIELEQRQDAPWSFPLQVAVETTRGRESRRVELTAKKQEARFRLAGSLLSVRLDDGGRLPFRVRQEERSVSMLLYQLAHEPDTAGRADALGSVKSLMASTIEESTRAQLKAALEERAAQDSTRLIRALAKKALEKPS
jgi:aminopeptidase N